MKLISPAALPFEILLFAILVLIGCFYFENVNASQINDTINALLPANDSDKQNFTNKHPTMYDPNLKVETVFKGIRFPTAMAFLGPNDILVLEKNEGTVQRIINGNVLSEPLLDVDVDNRLERGMLGIAVSKGEHKHPYVFLFYTEALEEYKFYCHWFSFSVDTTCAKGSKIDPLGNRLYRYDLVGNKLVNPKLLLDLPTKPGLGKIGGVTLVGPDSNVYLIIGDLRLNTTKQDKPRFDGRSGILRVTQEGQLVKEGEDGGIILGKEHPLNKYFAYGTRNSFGIEFDPVTRNLWNTENGLYDNDEINLVKAGFNSGWPEVQGIASLEQKFHLEYFGGKGKYSDPEFVWRQTVAVTSLKFLDSDKLGKEYENDLFVGDFNYGNLYHFDLNNNRTELSLEEPLDDKIANNMSELDNIIIGEGFGGIVDIEVGPDGYLYVLSIEKDNGGSPCRPDRPSSACVSYSSPAEGTIFRILPAADTTR